MKGKREQWIGMNDTSKKNGRFLSSDKAIFELLRELRADLAPVTRRSHASSVAKLLAIL